MRMWEKLAHRIQQRAVEEQAGVPLFLSEATIREEIEKFVSENIVKCYFKCDAETAKNAKGGD